MSRLYKIAIALSSLILLTFLACTDRGTNTPELSPESQVDSLGTWPEGDHVFVDDPLLVGSDPTQLRFQIRNTDGIQDMEVFIPKEAYRNHQPVPLLVLLAPMWGGKYFYTEHGLLELVHEMTTSGEIQPMVIACLGTDQLFGGYFWGNSYPAGRYDEIIAHAHENALINVINTWVPWVIDSPSKRGIGGVGMGAYGAFRAILKNPGQYSSVSVADGPLDFDGGYNGNQGLIDLFDDVLSEQGLPAADFKLIDSARLWPITSMIIGGSLAFSPHDTAVFYRVEVRAGNRPPLNHIDSTYVITDSTTLVEGIVNADMGNWDFHLPFDQTLQPYAPVWNLWMDNDLEALLADGGYISLDNVNMWIATSPDADYGFSEMTQAWITTLRAHDYTPEVHNYGGYDGNPATGNEYVYDLLREMLIFHSENFGD